MASGAGAFHGKGRCHDFWRYLYQCSLENVDSSACIAEQEDYLECIHFSKRKARSALIWAQEQKLKSEGKMREDQKSLLRPMGDVSNTGIDGEFSPFF